MGCFLLLFVPLAAKSEAFAFQRPSVGHGGRPSLSKLHYQAEWQYDMYCNQCEQTSHHQACTVTGICGKSSETAASQDALTELLKSIGQWAVAARAAGATEDELLDVNLHTLRATFSTLTNVNFSDERIAEYVREACSLKKKLKSMVEEKGGSPPEEDVLGNLDMEGMSALEIEEVGYQNSIPRQQERMGDEDAFSLHQASLYGLRGVCAYAAHCYQLGAIDADVMKSIHEIYNKLASSEPDMDGLLALVLRVGEVNAKVLAMLDKAHADNFGIPEPTHVRKTPIKGKAILVSGHDMMDLYELLKQTEGTGINVYTHGEMLPGHSFPKLKEFDHLAGNYGTAWQNQKFEFAVFPGPVIVTTNCIQEPRKVYRSRLYSMNEVGVDNVAHIGEDRDFSPVIQQALSMDGFAETIEPAEFHTVGFNHRAVLPLADKVIEAAQNGQLSRIFLMGGCDGTETFRNYYTDLAEAAPDDSLILTLGCAKNRVIHSEKLKGKTLANGLPRVLDMGQCNDSYSAIVVAVELAKALDCTVNELPLSLCLSHLEQKAAAVLMTLLHMGVQNIRLGPTLPAYITPNVYEALQKSYNLMGTGSAEEDMAAMMTGK